MQKTAYAGPLEKVDSCCFRIPKSYRPDMRVDGLIFANDRLIESIRKDQAPDQVANVATLPGIQRASLAALSQGVSLRWILAELAELADVKAPILLAFQLVVGMLLLTIRIVVHVATLPVEFDASFAKALPVIARGGYLSTADMPAARNVLRAAAWTYVAAALATLVVMTGGAQVLAPSAAQAQACRIAHRNLTRAEWADFLPERSYRPVCP